MKLLRRKARAAPEGPIVFHGPDHQEHRAVEEQNAIDAITALVQIGRGEGYVSSPGGHFDEHHCNKIAREIGRVLDSLGGMELMLAAHSRVSSELGPIKGRELEACWGGVGSWMR